MTYVLYHSSCYDGFGAAYSAWKALGERAKYIPVSYGNPPPEIPDGSLLFIVDFSYPREILLSLAERSLHVTVLDHHKTAEEALSGLRHPNLSIIFDMNKSGALLTWEHFHGPDSTPELIKYISDRDLWLLRLPKSAQVHKALVSYPMDFQVWDRLDVGLLAIEGETCERLYVQLVNSICRHAYTRKLDGFEIPVVNTSIAWTEVGHRLLELYPNAKFAASFTVYQDIELWSLRCRSDFDVSVVAKKFGGGGHKEAAGFQVPRV